MPTGPSAEVLHVDVIEHEHDDELELYLALCEEWDQWTLALAARLGWTPTPLVAYRMDDVRRQIDERVEALIQETKR